MPCSTHPPSASAVGRLFAEGDMGRQNCIVGVFHPDRDTQANTHGGNTKQGGYALTAFDTRTCTHTKLHLGLMCLSL